MLHSTLTHFKTLLKQNLGKDHKACSEEKNAQIKLRTGYIFGYKQIRSDMSHCVSGMYTWYVMNGHLRQLKTNYKKTNVKQHKNKRNNVL